MKSKWMLWSAGVVVFVVLLPLVGWALTDPLAVSDLAQGDDFLISRAVEDGSFVAMAYNDDLDEYLVVWSDARDGEAGHDIYGQFISSDGIPRNDNFAIQAKTGHGLWYPDVAYDSQNQRYLVVWEDITEFDVEGIVLNSDGTPFGPAFDIATGDSGDQRIFPAVASYAHDTAGTYAVAYQGGSSGDYNIYARHVSVDGSSIGNELLVSTESGDQTDPDLAVDPATGDFVIVWEDGRDAVDAIYGCLLYSTGFLGAEFAISSTSIPRANPAVAFSPDADEWLVVFQRDVNGDEQIGGRRVTAAGAPIGDGIYVCVDEADQTSPDVAYHATSDQFLVVWQDSRAGTTNYDVYGRRVGTDGSTVGNPFAISTAPDSQVGPAVAGSVSATTPGYLVVFDAGEDIDGQRVDTDGTLTGHEFTVSAPVGDQIRPRTACNTDTQNQECLVVWQDERAGDQDIYGQLVDLDGVLQGDNLIICSIAGDQVIPDVAYNPDADQYLVVWEDLRVDSDIYGQRVNADGSLDGGELPIAGSGATVRQRPRITYNSVSGEYLVVYIYGAENNNVRGRRVPADGVPTTAAIDIATGTAAQEHPDVACRAPSGGGYLVVWRETDGSSRDVRGQRVSPNGSLQGNILDICVQADDQLVPRLAYSPDADRYLVVWPDDRDSATQGRNLYGRQVGGLGALYDEIAISTAPEEQGYGSVSYSNGLGNYVVAWTDSRNAGTAPDLYAQRVSNDGALVDTTAGENEQIFAYSGWQQFPALAWGEDTTQGLAVWQDGRNGQSFHVYGLQLGSASHMVFLPSVLKND